MANKKKPEPVTPAPETASPPRPQEFRANGKPRWVKGPNGEEYDCLTLEPRK